MPTLTATQTNSKLPATRAEAAARIAVRHPQLSGMADRALAIADTDKVRPLSLTRVYVVAEQGGHEYELTATPHGWRCTCPAYTYRPAVINGRRYCKHTIALAIFNIQPSSHEENND